MVFTWAIFLLRLNIFCSEAGIRLLATKKVAIDSTIENSNVLRIARNNEIPEALWLQIHNIPPVNHR